MDLISNPLPQTLIRCKPDWHAAEVVSPRQSDYYTSSRALGVLFRSITLDDKPPVPNETAKNGFYMLTDPLSMALRGRVCDLIGAAVQPTGDFSDTERTYHTYCDELRYICATHTLSNTPGVRLLEAEVVAGTILAKCSQKRLRKDRIHQMRLHAGTLVRDVQRDFLETFDDAGHDEMLAGLQRAWRAWYFSQTKGNEFGASSFGLIALGVIFDCLDRL